MAANDITTNEDVKNSLFSVYCTHEMAVLDRKLSRFSALPKPDQEILCDYAARLQNLALRVTSNGKFLQVLMAHGESFLRQRAAENGANIDMDNDNDNNDNHDDALEIRQLFSDVTRDWSGAGIDMREIMYAPITAALQRYFDEQVIADPEYTRDKLRVCVPAAGTGRLCWEIAREGYSVEGNEASYLKLATSNYLLNHADALQPVSIYPYIHSFANVRSARAQLASVAIPDVSPVAHAGVFSMRVGNFLDVYYDYNNTNFDAVVTAFAFDLDENSGDIIRTVNNILRPGGVWIFIGPAPMPRDDSSLAILLSVPEFTSIVKKSGFKIIKDHHVDVYIYGDAI